MKGTLLYGSVPFWNTEYAGEHRDMSKKFDKRKKVVYDLICDDLYTPMKFKELAMLLRVAKEDRDELRQILEALEQEGKIYLSKRGKYCRGHAKRT